MANADLQRQINDLSIEKREADEIHSKLQADLDYELAVQRSHEGELDQFWAEFEAMESVLRQELSQAQEELKDSELQVASKRLEGANWLVKGAKSKFDCERIAFQTEKDGPL